jgi:drug/metabolite transporter (DMT)-like permease
MSEWFKVHAWKACIPKRYRGFESPSFRFSSAIKIITNEECVLQNKKIIGYILIFSSAVITSLAQFFWKLSTDGNIFFFILGFLLFIVEGFCMVLSYRFGELSVLQPILSVGFVFSLILGGGFMNEVHSIKKIIGIICVLCGVFLLAHSERKRDKND